MCATLAQIFPVLLLAGVLESVRVHRKIRVVAWYRNAALWELSAGVVGMYLSCVGMAVGGFESGVSVVWGGVNWVALAAAGALFAMRLVLIVATQQVEDETVTPTPPQARQRRPSSAAPRVGRRGRNLAGRRARAGGR